MTRITRIWGLAVCLAFGLGSASEILGGEFKLGGQTLKLPDGFEIDVVAGPSLVDRPIVADFDELGRLYVADSSGSNDKVEKQLEEKPHRIVRLEDTDGDGQFDKSIVFADRMMFPEGAMWLDGSLYVSAPPSIWKLTDTDGDGVCDQRVEWFAGKTLTGCANDLHGPYAGPDGWIYWCKGAFAKQTYDRPGKSPLVTRAAHIFRARPDGTGIEPVMTGGMDNPVDVVFTPGGERVFTTTFLQHPGGGKRDGLIHAVYGGVYGKTHDVIEDHPRTGDVLPVLSHLGPAAPCGLTRYESQVFGPEYQDNLFACCFNLHKVTRHVLQPAGATFQSQDEDFLTSDSLDFHPTDVHEDADGSLIVIDTGGWYKLCCPTSQLHKPDVLGAIYRIRKTGMPRVVDPRGFRLASTKQSVESLAELLADSRPVVRRWATRKLAQNGPAALGVLERLARAGAPENKLRPGVGNSPEARRNAVWALTAIDSSRARAAVRKALADEDPTVRQVALHSVSLWRDAAAAPQLERLLADRSNSARHNQRAAAEALGRIGDKHAVKKLLEATAALDAEPDRMLEHSLIYALIECAAPDETALGLKHSSPSTRRAALLALDQMPAGGLQPETVAELLGSSEALVQETAAWIAGRHADWGEALAGYLGARLAATDLTEAEQADLARLLARFAKSPSVRHLLASTLGGKKVSRMAQTTALQAIARSGMREPPPEWITALTDLLAADDQELVAQAVAAARTLPAEKVPDPGFAKALVDVGSRKEGSASVRLSALAAVSGGLPQIDADLFDFLRENLRPELEVVMRTTAADVLARSRLTNVQLALLTGVFKTAGPLEGDRLLPAYKESEDAEVGQKLIAALKESPGLSGLRVDAIRTNIARFPMAVQEQAEEVYQLLNVDLAKQKERLESLLASLGPGDVRRGQAVFHSTKAACAVCHALGYLGGNVGPDLTRIGGTRTERDLLEAIIFPSASFVRSYESVVVVTKAGKSHNGLVRSDSAEELILATGPREEVRLARDEIEEISPSTVSVMPSGLDQQLTPQDLADLLAFLKGAK